jgi:hypothetical protein
MEYRDFLDAEIGWGNIWGNKFLDAFRKLAKKYLSLPRLSGLFRP